MQQYTNQEQKYLGISKRAEIVTTNSASQFIPEQLQQ
jgi:hypothetical protein